MSPASSVPGVQIDRPTAARLFERVRARRWGLSLEDFAKALERSATRRFNGPATRSGSVAETSGSVAGQPAEHELQQYLDGLHLDDLALAAACARGHEAAWNYFVEQYRPAVLAAARSCAAEDVARELADSIYADLFGLEARDGVRRSLFEYFHGRSTLGAWLRAVLAQRAIDRGRASRRFEPLPDDPSPLAVSDPRPADVDRRRYLLLARAALTAALAALAPRDRLRLALYYARQMKLAAVGRVLGESEATTSRKLERTRTELRRTVEQRLREENRLSDAEIAECFEYARGDPAFDLRTALPDL